MGLLATRTPNNRLLPARRVSLKELFAEGEVDRGEVVYEVLPSGPKDLVRPDAVLEPGRTYGVVPKNDLGRR